MYPIDAIDTAEIVRYQRIRNQLFWLIFGFSVSWFGLLVSATVYFGWADPPAALLPFVCVFGALCILMSIGVCLVERRRRAFDHVLPQ